MANPPHEPTPQTRAEVSALKSFGVPPKMTEQVARAVCEQWLGVK